MTVDLDSWAVGYIDQLKPALRSALTGLADGVDPDDVVALGAYSDPDATSIVAALGTRANWEARVAAQGAYPNYFLWSPGEWDRTSYDLVDGPGADPLGAAMTEARRVSDEVQAGRAGDDTLQVFRFVVWESVVRALGQLFDDGFFDRFTRAVQVFDVMDEEVDAVSRAEWIDEINTDGAAARFRAYLADPYS